MEYVLEEIGKKQFDIKPVIAAYTWAELQTKMTASDSLTAQ
jgi:hypothetical protein